MSIADVLIDIVQTVPSAAPDAAGIMKAKIMQDELDKREQAAREERIRRIEDERDSYRIKLAIFRECQIRKIDHTTVERLEPYCSLPEDGTLVIVIDGRFVDFDEAIDILF